MTTCVAFLRAVNVGGNRLPMKSLVSLLEELGATSVRTYIQSGNAVFRAANADPARLAAALTAAIERVHGFAPDVLILEIAAVERAVARNPFPDAEEDASHLHLGFLAAEPTKPDLGALDALRAPSERFVLDGRVFYLHAPDGVGRSKLAARAERLLGVRMTDRNWRTVQKVRALAGE